MYVCSLIRRTKLEPIREIAYGLFDKSDLSHINLQKNKRII